MSALHAVRGDRWRSRAGHLGGGFALVGSLALLAACTPKGIETGVTNSGGNTGTGNSGSGGNSGTGNSGSGGNSGTGNSGAGGNPGTGGASPSAQACAQPNLGVPTLRLLTRLEVQTTLSAVFPELNGKWSSALPASQLSESGFDNDSGTAPGNQFVSGLLDTGVSLATALVGTDLANILPCSTSAADHACAETFLSKYGRRLFHRAPTTAERDRFLAFFDASKAKSDFKTALKWMTVGLIQSPSAVYRSEIGTDKGDGTRQLTGSEIATSLAYTFTGAPPSDDLVSKGESGSLGDLVATAKTMLATDAGKQTFQRFFEGYLAYTNTASIQRPNVDKFSTVSSDMVNETRAFINDVVVQKAGGVKELLTANTTNPSKALASYYGFPAPASDYATITRPTGRGIGVLSQGAFLSTHASPDASSPTRRGLFPFYRLLCQDKLTPPQNVPMITAPQPGQKTTRQRYEEAHAGMGAACAYCHKQFDPIGFSMEHYDEGGRYRDNEGGLPINSAGTVVKADGTTVLSFTGQEDLAMGFSNLPVIHQCAAAYLATYAFGSTESCLGASQVADLQAGKIGLAAAFTQLAAEPHFTKRTSK